MFSSSSSGPYSSDDMTYNNNGYMAQGAQQQQQQQVASPPRRRMNNPYSTKNPVRMVNGSNSTPVTSPIAQPMSRNSSTTNFAPASVPVVMETLSLPQVQQQQPAAAASSSSASSTGSIAPLTMPAPASSAAVIPQQAQSTTPQVNNSSITVSAPSSTATATAAAGGAAASSPYSGLSGDEMLADISARSEAELLVLARTANGSSMLQTAIKTDSRCAGHIWQHFGTGPALGELMLDAHGGYVVRALLDSVPRETARQVCDAISKDTRLAYSLCTHSLHTRRLVQGIMEAHDNDFLSGVLAEMCNEIARTQQGCIVMQRALDHSSVAPRTALVSAIAKHIGEFSADPFANYVVQYLLDSAPREEVVPMLWSSIRGRVLELSCNKFSSNVIEKFLVLADPQSQHELIVELYTSDPGALCHVMQDSFGNYIVQATIARSTFADLTFIDTQLRPILEHVPYGSKIAARLDRRLNPNHHAAAAAASAPGSNHYQHARGMGGGHHHQHQHQMGQQHGGYVPRGGARRNNQQQQMGYYQQQQGQPQQQMQQQQQQGLSIPAPHHGAAAMTYYSTPATAAW